MKKKPGKGVRKSKTATFISTVYVGWDESWGDVMARLRADIGHREREVERLKGEIAELEKHLAQIVYC